MRVVSGKVVGNTVVLEETLPEGSDVDVVLRSVGDGEEGWDLSARDWAAIDESMNEADQGLLVSSEAVLAQVADILK